MKSNYEPILWRIGKFCKSAWGLTITLFGLAASLVTFWPRISIEAEPPTSQSTATYVAIKNDSNLCWLADVDLEIYVGKITGPNDVVVYNIRASRFGPNFSLDHIDADETRYISLESAVRMPMIVDADFTVTARYRYLSFIPLHTTRRFVSRRLSDGQLRYVPKRLDVKP